MMLRDAFATALLHFLWQGTLLALLASILLRLLDRSRPELRYTTACLCLAAMFAAPIATTWWLSGDALPATHSAAQTTSQASWTSTMLLLWAAGASLLLLRSCGGLALATLQLTKGRTLPPASLQTRFEAIAKSLRITGRIRLFLSTRVTTPSVIGILRPIVLMPTSLVSSLSVEQLEAILAHELAHIARHDFLVNCLQTVIEAALFYHPAMWWLSARIRHERELCCDRMASELCGDPILYSRALLALEEARPALLPAATGGNLRERIERLTGIRKPQATGSAQIIILALTIAAAAVWALPPDKTAPPPPPPPPRKLLKRDLKPWGSTAPKNDEAARRLSYAKERFGSTDSDRSQIYIQQGPPDQIESHPNPKREIWRYNDQREYEFKGDDYNLERVRLYGSDYQRVPKR